METIRTKEAAEAALREMPSVLGAFVREDIHGHPREVHLLVAPGPVARELARDVRGLLEERLGVHVDQRIISIAQLVRPLDAPASSDADAAAVEAPRVQAPPRPAEPRPALERLESHAVDGRIRVAVRVDVGGRSFEAECAEVDGGTGRIRAAATATLEALVKACGGTLRLETARAQPVRALGRDYIVVGVRASAARLGRRPRPLLGAHPVDASDEDAAALAALHAVNRVVGPELAAALR